jgi:hypothetical protein
MENSFETAYVTTMAETELDPGEERSDRRIWARHLPNGASVMAGTAAAKCQYIRPELPALFLGKVQ